LLVVGTVGEDDSTDGFAARLSGDGSLRWYRTYGSAGPEALNGVVPTDDGFAYAGSTAGEGSSHRAWLVRVDENGVQQFARTYERRPTAANDIVRAGDGYVIAGEISRSVSGRSARQTDAWAARLAANGNVQWASRFGTEADNESAAAVAPVGDGYVLAGRSQPRDADDDGDDASERRGWYAGTTGDGDERWTRTYGDRRAAFSEVAAGNDSLVLIGTLGQRSDADLTVLRADADDGAVTEAFVSDTDGGAIARRGLIRDGRVVAAGTLLGEADSQTWLLGLAVPGSVTTPTTPTPTNTTTTPTPTNTTTTPTLTNTTTPTPTTSTPTPTTSTPTTTAPDTTTAPTTATSTTASPTPDGTETADPGGLPVPGFTFGAAVLAVLAAALLAARRR
jgi:hypothetical protein